MLLLGLSHNDILLDEFVPSCCCLTTENVLLEEKAALALCWLVKLSHRTTHSAISSTRRHAVMVAILLLNF
jgi:hypothetical protein